MPLTKDRLPNTPLTGYELRLWALALLTEELAVRSVPDAIVREMVDAFNLAMANDFLFAHNAAYPGIMLEIVVRMHRCGERAAFSIVPTFTHRNDLPVHTVLVRGPEPPLAERDGEEQVEAFTLKATAENPNLIRIHYGIPIVVMRKIEPKPGDLFPKFEPETIEYDPAEFESPAAPEVIDATDIHVALWGVKEVMPTERDAHIPATVDEAGAESAVSVPASSEKRKSKKGWNK